jgi:hypothetical protein
MNTKEIVKEVGEGFIPHWRINRKTNWMFYKSILDRCINKEIYVMEYFNELNENDKEKFVNGFVHLYGKFRMIKGNNLSGIKKKKEIKLPKLNGISEMKNKNLDDIFQLKEKLRRKITIIDNNNKSNEVLIERNVEIQNRLFYEERVNRVLKERLKKFESLLCGGINKKTN